MQQLPHHSSLQVQGRSEKKQIIPLQSSKLGRALDRHTFLLVLVCEERTATSRSSASNCCRELQEYVANLIYFKISVFQWKLKGTQIRRTSMPANVALSWTLVKVRMRTPPLPSVTEKCRRTGTSSWLPAPHTHTHTHTHEAP